jgi:hypothetical protein
LQKTSPTLQLNDLFIGDEGNLEMSILGCVVLAEFLKTNDSYTALELKGNNITGQGISSLCEYISQSRILKQ